MDVLKNCRKCLEDKSLDDFSKDKHQKDEKNIYCKKCISIASKERKKKEKIKLLEKKANKPVKIPKNKIRCNRGGKIMLKTLCIPGCNNACNTCDNPQMKNIKAGGEPVTLEEDKEMLYSGVVGGQFGRMMEEAG